MSRQYTAKQFIDAIPGTGGIISAIARRVGCDWHTAKRYIDNMPTVKKAYNDERESLVDMAESVLVMNIRLAQKQQSETGRPVDAGDAKWYLRYQARDRGYVERTEVTGSEGGPVTIHVVYDDELDGNAQEAT